ncbi:S8 family serine peptidase [Wenzhouxiangella marina]|uniref:Serine protease n=1 Tax=Wenzhouxiangella marina TaxID=1579979 RepID=A0A0K0XS33_9GAMM|nr:S8 family serine peptidase [Wenzhouxiangella marina]AKS40465.1 serine protease [Wenzhouxiangella marina]MBB6088213.1 putative repeat protein (TIGR01451 family) [Wenzhouxiangella marina]
MTLIRTILPAALLLAVTAGWAQIDPALSQALEGSERVPVIVAIEDTGGSTELNRRLQPEAMAARLARQDAIIERALNRPIAELETASATESRLRRRFRSVPLVSMLLNGAEISALLADPAVTSIVLDDLVAPASDGTMPLIGASALHSAGLTGAGVSTAILDTGVDHEHPMFAGRIIESVCFSSNVDEQSISLCPGAAEEDLTTPDAGDDCAYSGDSTTPIGGCGHGTHVAGIAAGAAFVDPVGGATLIGVAPSAGIVAVQVFSRFDSLCAGFGLSTPCALSYTSDQIAALDWLLINRASLSLASANMSLGGGQYTGYCNTDPRFGVISNLRDLGVATAIASGNSGFNNAVGAPGCIEPAITVGATNDSDVVASFSNSATMIDLLAPGVAINSAEPTIDDTLPGRARSISGTSMATPHVAGAIALLKSAHPNASVDQIEAALASTGVPVTESPSGLVRPRIRVDLAHAVIDATPPGVESILRLSPSNEFTNVASVTWRVRFTEVVENVTADDFLVSGTTGTVSIGQLSAQEADVTVSGGDMASVDGVVSLGFAVGQDIQDPAGNPLDDTTPIGANQSYTLDHTAPILNGFVRFSPSDEQTDADVLVFELSFSEAVTSISIDDFDIVGTTAVGSFMPVNASTYQITLSGGDLADLNGTVGLNLSFSQDVRDTVGNFLGTVEPAIDETYSIVNGATVGGAVTGLVGTGLRLQNNGGDDLLVSGDGPFVFGSVVPFGDSYEVTVATDPSEPAQRCEVTNESGQAGMTPIDNVQVDCRTIIDLSISISSDAAVLEPGAGLSYVITVINQGPVAVSSARVTNLLPAELVDASWVCMPSAGSVCAMDGFGSIDELVDLQPGGQVTFLLSAVAAVGEQHVLFNVAEVSAPGDVLEDEVSNNSASDRLATDSAFDDRFEP